MGRQQEREGGVLSGVPHVLLGGKEGRGEQFGDFNILRGNYVQGHVLGSRGGTYDWNLKTELWGCGTTSQGGAREEKGAMSERRGTGFAAQKVKSEMTSDHRMDLTVTKKRFRPHPKPVRVV